MYKLYSETIKNDDGWESFLGYRDDEAKYPCIYTHNDSIFTVQTNIRLLQDRGVVGLYHIKPFG